MSTRVTPPARSTSPLPAPRRSRPGTRRGRRRARARRARGRSVPPGEVTSRRTASVSYSRCCEQRGGPGHRLGHQPGGQAGGETVADGGVDLGLDEQRLVGRPDAHHRRRPRPSARSGTWTTVPTRSNSSITVASSRASTLVGRARSRDTLARPRPECSASTETPACRIAALQRRAASPPSTEATALTWPRELARRPRGTAPACGTARPGRLARPPRRWSERLAAELVRERLARGRSRRRSTARARPSRARARAPCCQRRSGRPAWNEIYAGASRPPGRGLSSG